MGIKGNTRSLDYSLPEWQARLWNQEGLELRVWMVEGLLCQLEPLSCWVVVAGI